MNAKLISVIIPVYQGEKYLAEALDSIFAQNYRPIEVLVVDDGSTDATASIAKSYPEVRYFFQANQGHCVAKNTGLANCTGDLITFLDADDYWLPNNLEIQSAYLEAHPEVGCGMGKGWNFLQDGMTRPRWISEAMMTEDGGGWHLGASLMHRWVLDRIGHLNVSYFHGNDFDLFIRMREAKIPAHLVNSCLLRRRIHGGNLSQDQNTLARERVRILKAHMDRKRGKVAESLPGVR